MQRCSCCCQAGGGESGILTASLVVPFSLHLVKSRKKSELSTETKLGTVSVWRGGPVRRMQRASELLDRPHKYSTNKVVRFS